MYYIKNFLLYSLSGFIMESTLFKIVSCPKKSGIFYGPMTAVYGVGIIAILLLNKYFFKKIKCNKYFKYLIEFITLTIILSLIEYIGGNTLHKLFNIDMWNYSKKFLNIGKYICLINTLIWGLLGVLFIHILKPFTDKIINIITTKETIIASVLFITDLLAVLILKL